MSVSAIQAFGLELSHSDDKSFEKQLPQAIVKERQRDRLSLHFDHY